MNTLVTYLALVAIIPFCLAVETNDRPQTLCERHREREKNIKNPIPGRVIPKCDENGNYDSKQCFGESTNGKPFCSCWSSNGDIITTPSRSLETCGCHINKHIALKQRDDYIPSCERSGKYSPKQCNSKKECWCSNSRGEKLDAIGSSSLTCSLVP